jgi:hypothetical protein
MTDTDCQIMPPLSTNQIVFFDAPDTDEPVDLDAHLRVQFGAGRRIESLPVFTTIVGDVALTVIRVTVDRRYRHQVYAIDEGTWSLVGIFALYMDALSELLAWRCYIESGGTVAAWQDAHPNGIYPERSGFLRTNAPSTPEIAEIPQFSPRSPTQPFAITALSKGGNPSLLDTKTAAPQLTPVLGRPAGVRHTRLVPVAAIEVTRAAQSVPESARDCPVAGVELQLGMRRDGLNVGDHHGQRITMAELVMQRPAAVEARNVLGGAVREVLASHALVPASPGPIRQPHGNILRA